MYRLLGLSHFSSLHYVDIDRYEKDTYYNVIGLLNLKNDLEARQNVPGLFIYLFDFQLRTCKNGTL